MEPEIGIDEALQMLTSRESFGDPAFRAALLQCALSDIHRFIKALKSERAVRLRLRLMTTEER